MKSARNGCWAILICVFFALNLLVYFKGAGAVEKGKGQSPSPSLQKSQSQIDLSKNFRLSFTAAVKKYVEKNLDKDDKLFHFWDDFIEDEWLLSLNKVRDENLVSLGNDRYFAPVDFVHKNQASVSEDTPLVLDVYALRIQEGWEIEEIYIHSVNEVNRYSYDKEYNRIFSGEAHKYIEE